MIAALAQLTLVVVDVETTGWLHEQAEITEIGAVRLTGGQLTGEFSSLVRPAGPIPAEITALTGITDRDGQPGAAGLPRRCARSWPSPVTACWSPTTRRSIWAS